MSSPLNTFFFDLSLADINAIACSANRLLFHGSAHGAFGSFGSKRADATLNLDAVDAISINLEHLSNFALSDEYDYKLIYLRNKNYETFWKGSKSTVKGLKDLACIAQLSNEANLCPKTQRVFLVSVSDRPVAVAPYDFDISSCHHVPATYSSTLRRDFRAILVRTKKINTPKFNLLFAANSMDLVSSREANDGYDGNLTVRCYSSVSQRATCFA